MNAKIRILNAIKKYIVLTIVWVSILEIVRLIKSRKMFNPALEGKVILIVLLVFILPYAALQALSFLISKDVFYLTFFADGWLVPKEHNLRKSDYFFSLLYAFILMLIGAEIFSKGLI